MDVLIIPSGINPLDASFPGDGGGCAYACAFGTPPKECTCDRGATYNECPHRLF